MLWWIQSNVNPKIKILKPKNIGQRRLNIYFDALYPYIILNPITFIICWKCVLKSNSKLGHLHLKVSSTSIATFRTSLVILPYFVWISSKIFLFFNVSQLEILLNIYILKISREQWLIWMSERIFLLFCFVYGCKQNKKIS